ncbi:MAG: PLP-dependent aminotransferase family protein [Pseudonocardia sp.]
MRPSRSFEGRFGSLRLPRSEAADVPLRARLYAQLRAAILGGQLPAGTRLPSSRMLAAELGVSRNTVLAALEQLYAEGYVEGRHGSGTFVTRSLPDDLLSARVQAPPARVDPEVRRRLSQRGLLIAGAPRTPIPAFRGGPVTDRAFTIGLPALDAFPVELWSQLFGRWARSIGTDEMCYGDPAGHLPLRRAIAAHLATSRGVRCTAEQVVVVSGSQQALDLVARLLLDPGDAAWIEDPGYLGVRAALIAAGADVVPVRVDGEGLDVAAGIAAGPTARLAVVTPSHQFPLGTTMSLSRRLALLEWAGSTGDWIVEDDYDAEFRYVGRPLTALQGIDGQGCVIYVGTFSKSLFPGLRLGYLVAPPELVDGFAAAHLSADIHAPLLTQAVLAEFIEAGHFERHLRRMRSLYAQRQAAVVSAIGRHLGDEVDVPAADSGLHLVGTLGEGLDDAAVARHAAAHGVDVWPMSMHVIAHSPGAAVLLGFAHVSRDRLCRGVSGLARAVQDAKGER